MTVPMDCMISYTAGSVFAISSGNAIGTDPEKTRKALWRGRLFTAFITVPIGLYFMLRWPDWSWMYFAKKHPRNPLLGAAGLGAYIASHELGFRHAAGLIKRGRLKSALVYTATSFAAFWLIVALGWERLRWQGTREEFEAGLARDTLFRLDFLIPLVVGSLLFFLGVVYGAIRNLRA